MKHIVYARVDDRLVHGQVMTAWVLHTRASKVIIVDDKAARDSFMKMIMKIKDTASGIQIFSILQNPM